MLKHPLAPTPTKPDHSGRFHSLLPFSTMGPEMPGKNSAGHLSGPSEFPEGPAYLSVIREVRSGKKGKSNAKILKFRTVAPKGRRDTQSEVNLDKALHVLW